MASAMSKSGSMDPMCGEPVRNEGPMSQVLRAARMMGLFSLSLLLPFACGNDNPPPPPPEQTGSSCTVATVATDCYPNLDGGALQGGTRVCIDKVSGGYCTHFCTMNSDCCAVPGEC